MNQSSQIKYNNKLWYTMESYKNFTKSPGRINRVGTKHSDIHIYNFFPTKQSNDQLQLEENVKSKMQAFISLLGEDAKHLTESEEIENHKLFAKNL